METNLALTIIGYVLILVGIIFNAVPKLVNEKIMGQLPKDAVGLSALFRVVLGGLAIAIGTIALYCRHLPAEHAGHLLFPMGSGFVIVILIKMVLAIVMKWKDVQILWLVIIILL